MRRTYLRYAAAFIAGAAVATAAGLTLREVIRDDGGSDEVVLQRLQIRVGAPGAAAEEAGIAPAPVGPELLPDLDQEVPAELLVIAAGAETWLAFDSAVSNVGRGPLVIEGQREGVDGAMTVVQTIELAGGGTRRYPSRSRLVFASSEDHSHWHLLPFQRYELRRAGDYSLAGSDRKTGFCLGDRFVTSLPSHPAAMPRDAVYTELCGLDSPELTEIREGISVGYGDVYRASLEGQYLDLTRVPAGRYVLVHRVNWEGRLREAGHANNAASILLRLSRPAGRPRLDVLLVCPDSERCAPGAAR